MFKTRKAGWEENKINNGGRTVAFLCLIFLQPASLWHRWSEKEDRVLEWGK